MAYEKQNWVCGDTLTAEKLNHMEQGIEDASQSGGGSEIVNMTTTIDENNCLVCTLDKTASELYDIVFTQGKDIKITGESNGSVGYLYPVSINNSLQVSSDDGKISLNASQDGGGGTPVPGAFVITVMSELGDSNIADLVATSWDAYPTYTICPNEGGGANA